MTEKTVQVPASLIDTLRDLVERDAEYDPANPNARRSWEHGIDCESIAWGYDGIEGDSGDPCDCWVSVVADLLSQPTLPRIADMAPGTKFLCEGKNVPGVEHHMRVTEDVYRDGTRVLWCLTHEFGATAPYVDESTIHDVTPPKE